MRNFSRIFHNTRSANGGNDRQRHNGLWALSAGDLNRSTQHLLILLDKEVADGDVTDIVHGEAEG
jgi:hypothetical protein